MEKGMTLLHDMHCHLDFMANGDEIARDARTHGTLLFGNTVEPEAYTRVHTQFAPYENVSIGFGMHPWWVGEKHADQMTAITNLLEEHNPCFIGEVGLDLGKRYAIWRDGQIEAFSRIAQWAASRGDKLMSIHAVKSAPLAFELLEETGCLRSCRCIFHWFSGPSDTLKRAINAGCYFSCGIRMLATKKGREYTKAIPATQLLLETDEPPAQGVLFSYAELRASLESAAASVAAIKGDDALDIIAQTSASLLNR